jgi:L-lysine exporter family protein LysE/ArgO
MVNAAFFAGYGVALSLIVAIGAQNALVLRYGLRREHVLPLVLFCATSDAILITVGVMGFTAMTNAAPWVEPLLTYGGAAFLIAYGARSFLSAYQGGQALVPSEVQRNPLIGALAAVTAITWLNPHVYLDTVLLIGSVSAEYDDKIAFATGAISASFSFFFTLGYGARLLTPFFAKPSSWQVLDAGVGLLMWAIALKLLLP